MTDGEISAAEAVWAPGAAVQPISRRHVTAAVVGNWLEFYDFTVYAYFALQIGQAFFPNHSEFARLMLSLITFGAGFVCRPVGAVVIGRLADRTGRRPAMMISFTLMGAALLGLVFVPTYAQIGLAAPILVVALRVVQGFALGGEVGPTTAYLIEAAPVGRRGLYGAWQSASQSLASLSGGLIGVILAQLVGAAALAAWGWRIAFLIGALVLPFGLLIRRTLPETRHAPELRLDAHPEGADILSHWRVILLGLGLIAGATISTYVSIFTTTYAQTTLHMGLRVAFWVTVVNGATGFAAALAGGALSDRFGRRALMIWPRLAFIVAILPAFMTVIHFRQPAVLLTLMGALTALANLAAVPALVALTESLRKEVRGVVTATVYALAVAVFGGTTQPIVAWLGEATGSPLAIAWYLMAANVVALIAALLMIESAPPRAEAAAGPL
ncbi:MAG: MFS transporter [Caulobacteraceae bacterium]|nr:MFS transporter [Caulobacteraceae bacterium]